MARRKRKRPHGTGSVRVRGGRAQIQWTNPDGTRGTRTVDLDQYQDFLARACAGLEVATPVDGGNSKSLGALAETWLAGRSGMASNYDDRNRWKNHLLPIFGHLIPDEVDVPALKKAIVALREKGLGKGTVRLCVALLSSLYGDLVEDGVARVNPARMLSRKTRQNELRSEHDPKLVPFVHTPREVALVHYQLAKWGSSVALAYVVGALAGLRTNEVRALRWKHVDLDRRLIHVQEQVKRRGVGTTILKDKDSRFVPISDSLLPILEQASRASNYHFERADRDLVCTPPLGIGFLGEHGMADALADALRELRMEPMTWYEATRHTFASQWVLSGGTLETLQQMMGHSSVTVTERYAHLLPGRYTDADRARVAVEVTVPAPTLSN